ncbi:MAG: fluoride efflux transporter CrcB [Solirubrobacteraceae bacterium]
MSLWVWIGVALLGGAGAVARFALDAVISARSDGLLPLGTLTVNLSGAFVLGLLTGLNLGGNTLLLAGTATIGAYTTFSTWMLETHRLAEDRARRLAALNIVLSLAAGIGAAALGRVI